MIPISKPAIDDEEARAVQEVLRSGMLAQGEIVEKFEKEFANYIGVKHGVAVCNGSVALDLALKACQIGSGDEVITTPFTFISTANSILYQGAKPVFADIDSKTFNIDPEDVQNKITQKTKAILGVHIFGHPFELNPIIELCEDHGLVLIEDCAQAHGAEYKGKKVGSFGLGCFSFYATKNMTTGEGGMITTSNNDVAEICRLLRNHGEAGKYNHVVLGYNYRMTEVQAAMGRVQLKKLDLLNNSRIKNAEFLTKKIKRSGLRTPFRKSYVKHVYHQYAVVVEDEFPYKRDELLNYLRSRGIGCAVHYPKPVFEQPLYKKLGYKTEEVKCPISQEICKKIISLPVHPALRKEELEYIAEVINEVS